MIGREFWSGTYKPASPAQLDCLRELGVEVSADLTAYEANRLIAERRLQWERLPPTERQKYVLQQHELWSGTMTRGVATMLIDRLKRAPSPPAPPVAPPPWPTEEW